MNMSIESKIVTSLNSWGASHESLIKILSNDLVYIAILLGALWIFVETFKANRQQGGKLPSIPGLITNSLLVVAFPIGLTVVVSELISKLYLRQRPFVTLSELKLLVPHNTDGGMPSHHIAFMTALVVCVYFYDGRAAALFGALTLLSGFGRVSAGIHYPSDIIAGIGVGIAVVYLYRITVTRLFSASILTIRP